MILCGYEINNNHKPFKLEKEHLFWWEMRNRIKTIKFYNLEKSNCIIWGTKKYFFSWKFSLSENSFFEIWNRSILSASVYEFWVSCFFWSQNRDLEWKIFQQSIGYNCEDGPPTCHSPSSCPPAVCEVAELLLLLLLLLLLMLMLLFLLLLLFLSSLLLLLLM